MESPPSAAPRMHNGFDLLRLLLAVAVVYSHARLLGGFGEDWIQPAWKQQTIPGTLAVLGFFGLSGYLVSQSFLASGRWVTFLRHRALRILPAFYLALVFTAFVAAPVIAHLRHAAWSAEAAARFVGLNATLRIHGWTVGGELAGLPYADSINGALWSLFPEACCYGLVMVLGLTGALGRRPHEAVILAGCFFLTNLLTLLPSPLGTPALPSFLVLSGLAPFVLAFAVGTCAQAYRSRLNFGRSGAVLFGLLTIAALKFGGWQIFGPVLFPLFILHLGHSFSLRLKVDLSYGLYIFHFPCFQALSAAGWERAGFASYFLAGLLVAGGLATASWFAVERPALRFK